MATPYGLAINETCQSCKRRAAGFFCNLSPAALKDLEAIRSTAVYPAGALLFLENQDPHGVFLLCAGKVKLTISSSEGKTLILRLAEPGEILGLTAVATGTSYEVTAETMYPSQVVFIRRQDFLRLMDKHPEIYQGATQHLSTLFQSACEQLRTIGLSTSAQEKVARLLLHFSTGLSDARANSSLKLHLTHEEIASCIGSTRETVTRTLSEFKAKRVVTLHGRALTIEDREALEMIGGV